MSNIAFIVTKSEIGGAQTWTNDMMELVRNGNTVHLITSEIGWLTEQNNYDNCFLLPQLKKKFSFWGYLSLLKYIKKEKINVMVASSANAGIFQDYVNYFIDLNAFMYRMVGPVFIMEVLLNQYLLR